MRGDRPRLADSRGHVTWGEIADREPLMRRMEQAQRERLATWVARADRFRSNAAGIYHEAQIVAALAEVIRDEPYEDGADESYVACARLFACIVAPV